MKFERLNVPQWPLPDLGAFNRRVHEWVDPLWRRRWLRVLTLSAVVLVSAVGAMVRDLELPSLVAVFFVLDLLLATLVPLILVTSTMIGENRWLTSAPRFALEWLAPFVILARIGRNVFVDRIVLMLFLSLQTVMLATFVLHVNWVA